MDKKRPLHIIMPMAGEGLRFLKGGYKIPKPLIQFKNKTLFERAIMSVAAINAPYKYSFVVRQEHIELYQIDHYIKSIFPDAFIFSVEQTTRGAVETCLFAKDAIDINDAILILDCDLEFHSQEFNERVTSILSVPVEYINGGILVSFNAENPRYSFAEIQENRIVIRTAEKEVISKHALAGAYFFSKAASFLFASDALFRDNSWNKSEYYVSLLFNYLINRREKVFLTKVDRYSSYGTPEELEAHYL
jgi:dTDP-glucose pyrophosphorylase